MTLTPFRSHLQTLYNLYWGTVDSARLILLYIDQLALTEATTLAAVLAAEIASENGYTVGGAPINAHAATYDGIQERAEGRPDPVTFTADGGDIVFNAWALIVTRNGQDEAVCFHHYGGNQVISGPSNSREITVALNLGGPNADVVALDIP